MATNGTSQSGIESATDGQQASGQSIFWALAAIVFSAMLQPSFSGYLSSGDAPFGSVWPHRSSPTMCLLDAIAEIWILIDKRRNPHLYRDGTAPAKQTDVAMRLTLFALGVMPQAIKLFSMRGIPVTQALAVMFLVPSLVSMARTTCIDAPQQDISKIVKRLKTSDKRSVGVVVGSWYIGWGLHGLALLLIWHQMAGEAGITTTQTIAQVIEFAHQLTLAIYGTYILQHMAFMVVGMKPRIPRYPILIILFCTANLGIRDLVLCPNCRTAEFMNRGWQFSAALLLNVSLCSYGMACVLGICAKGLLSWSNRRELPVAESSSAISTTTLSNIDGSAITTVVVDCPPRVTPTTHDWSVVEGGLRLPAGPPPAMATSANAPSPLRAIDDEETAPASATTSGEERAHGTLPALSPGPEVSIPAERISMQPLAGASGTLSSGNANDEVTATSNENHHSDPEPATTAQEEDDKLSWFIWILIQVPILIYLVLLYAGLDPFDQDSAGDNTMESAAERGTAPSGSEQPSLPTAEPSLLRKVVILLNEALRFLTRRILITAWRLYKAQVSLYVYTLKWVGRKVRRRPTETLMVSFGIVNFTTAIVYYLAHFDGTGTFTPEWTTVLG